MTVPALWVDIDGVLRTHGRSPDSHDKLARDSAAIPVPPEVTLDERYPRYEPSVTGPRHDGHEPCVSTASPKH